VNGIIGVEERMGGGSNEGSSCVSSAKEKKVRGEQY
jgi:hypothetical protein